MRGGTLRNRITIERATVTRDQYGAPVPTWGTWATVWSEIKPVSGSEIAFAQTFGATVSHKIELRYLAGLLVTDRIWYGSTRLFAINAVTDPEERKREMVLWCEEIVNSPEVGNGPSGVEFDTLSVSQFDAMN